MSKAKVRVGIVGAGPIGGLGRRPHSHAAGYRRCEDAELLAVADINPQRLQQFGDEWEVAPQHRYATAVETYDKAGLDVVSVTTHLDSYRSDDVGTRERVNWLGIEIHGSAGILSLRTAPRRWVNSTTTPIVSGSPATAKAPGSVSHYRNGTMERTASRAP